ncbi:MAG TPA: type II toxin-antitoxin system HipA family toxin [Bacteroidales bacterium]|nr:type II toxin-antitoxin system HipA family toxin [Bacteroidales bacterium]
MHKLQLLNVRLHGQLVGKLALTPDYVCAFEYDTDYIKTGVSISPFHLPLKPGVFQAKLRPFDGNFGVFDDSLPDGWGSLLLDRFLRNRGTEPQSLSILQRLSIIGNTGRGALEYDPVSPLVNEQVNRSTLSELAQEAELLLGTQNGNTPEKLDELYLVGGSSGGAQPKVFVTREGKEWLVKFKASIDPPNIGEIEYRYSLLAKQCGIDMPETRLFEGKYFATQRFDRNGSEKYHVVSAGGLLHADYRIPSLDYQVLLAACFKLTRNMDEVIKLFRLMVFNVLIGNKDDHAKNFAFILRGKDWFLSPAYDLLPSNGFGNQHTTTVNNSGRPKRSDIFQVADLAGIPKTKAKEVVECIENGLRNF